MEGKHRLTLSVPVEIMAALQEKVPRGQVNAHIVALIQKDLAKKRPGRYW